MLNFSPIRLPQLEIAAIQKRSRCQHSDCCVSGDGSLGSAGRGAKVLSSFQGSLADVDVFRSRRDNRVAERSKKSTPGTRRMIVLNAWPKRQQPGADRVRHLLEAAERGEQKPLMNVMNRGVVFYVSVRARDLSNMANASSIPCARRVIISATNSLVMTASTLKAQHAISYVDASAATTEMLRLPW